MGKEDVLVGNVEGKIAEEDSILIFGGVTEQGLADPEIWRLTREGAWAAAAADGGGAGPGRRLRPAALGTGGGTRVLVLGGAGDHRGGGGGGCQTDGFELDLYAPTPKVLKKQPSLQEGIPMADGTIMKELANGDKYTGTFKGDQRWGTGKCEYAKGGVYEGEWAGDAREGRGRMAFANGDVYAGAWAGGRRHGPGRMEYRSLRGQKNEDVIVEYDGNWDADVRSGAGRCRFADGAELEGAFAAGVPHGPGVLAHLGGGATLHGRWEGGVLAEGRLARPRGEEYEGVFGPGRRPQGPGAAYYPDGSSYRGEWRNGKRNGTGRFEDGRKRFTFEGKWIGGERSGKGRCEYANGSVYEGTWANGKRSGQGAMQWANGDVYAGGWALDRRHGQGTYLVRATGRRLEGRWEEDEFLGDAEEPASPKPPRAAQLPGPPSSSQQRASGAEGGVAPPSEGGGGAAEVGELQPSVDFSVSSTIEQEADFIISAKKSFSNLPTHLG